jgi:hypothetical protein
LLLAFHAHLRRSHNVLEVELISEVVDLTPNMDTTSPIFAVNKHLSASVKEANFWSRRPSSSLWIKL